ncbi:Uncharacterized protein PHSC3_000260 [Chlamydiales bacterium STE3]|nr:Uncharacterized protein PHSC3_000260 [Chlamydiales bacterium STE3]
MNLSNIQFIFNRAFAKSFSFKKNLLTFAVLALFGVFIVFCQGLRLNANNNWIATSLVFLPIFLCSGVLLATGIILIRLYHDEVKNKEISYSGLIGKSWEIVLGASYFSIPIILIYLLLWMLLGIFILLEEIPGIGGFFSAILSFAPFLLNLATLVLCVLVIGLLFFVTPIVALKGLSRSNVTNSLIKRMKGDVFANVFLFVIGIAPLVAAFFLLFSAAYLTKHFCEPCGHPVQVTLQLFFIMIPFAAILSPSVVFFFNFAVESHVLINGKMAKDANATD